MNQRRVTEEFPRSLDAQLLRAGRELGPSPEQLPRMLAAVNLLGPSGAKAVGLAVTIKWATAGIVSGVALVGAVAGARIAWLRSDQRPHVEVNRPTQMDDTQPLAEIPAMLPTAEPLRDAGPESAAGIPTPTAWPSESRHVEGSNASLGQEVALIDRVRNELRQHRAYRALLLLDEHARQFQAPRLAEEAAYLRVLALDGAGRTREAERATERFHERFPTSPLLRADVPDDRSDGAPKETERESQ